MDTKRKIVIYICCSIDGFIAGPEGSMDFLAAANSPTTDYGYADFMKTVDTVILGRKTYDWVMTQVLEFPHRAMPTFVVTKAHPRESVGLTQFYTGDLVELAKKLKAEQGKKNVFVDGGAEVIAALLAADLVDELTISTLPVFLGSGTRLFKEPVTSSPQWSKWKLLSSRTFDSGLVQTHYAVH